MMLHLSNDLMNQVRNGLIAEEGSIDSKFIGLQLNYHSILIQFVRLGIPSLKNLMIKVSVN